jgi:NADH dehydrogenase
VGSLRDIDAHERDLAGVDTIVHLAAATGKARPEEFFASNVEGTERLVQLCRRVGARRLLYVSSIAVRFPDKRHYYYAQSKEQAEEVVRRGGLQFTILRPTMVLGRGSPVYSGLAKLAQLPVLPIFGDGRTLIQPIHVDDLVACIIGLLDSDCFRGETLDVGGPEVISIEEFLKKIYRLHHDRAPRVIHIPLALLIPALTLLEKFAYPLLPFTLGQMSTFRFNGTAQKSPLTQEGSARFKTVDEMLAASLVS